MPQERPKKKKKQQKQQKKQKKKKKKKNGDIKLPLGGSVSYLTTATLGPQAVRLPQWG